MVGSVDLENKLHDPQRHSFDFEQVLFRSILTLLRYLRAENEDRQTDSFSALYSRWLLQLVHNIRWCRSKYACNSIHKSSMLAYYHVLRSSKRDVCKERGGCLHFNDRGNTMVGSSKFTSIIYNCSNKVAKITKS